MSEADRDAAIRAAMKAAALKARLLDLDWLKLVDTSTVTLEADGTVKGADELMVELKAVKPFLFGKHVREMSETERAAELEKLKRGPPPEPMPTDLTAKEMTEAQRKEWLREHSRRFG
jgi:hypothetical protein